MVNTELKKQLYSIKDDYNILNIVVNTEQIGDFMADLSDYNILNIVVNTEQKSRLC